MYPYNDILNTPYPNPEIEYFFQDELLREAEFAPFAALSGHENAIAETARQTSPQLSLSESQKESLDQKLRFLKEQLSSAPFVTITHFVKDVKKEGGSYHTKQGILKSIHTEKNTILFTDQTKIPIKNIIKVESTRFPDSIS